MRLFLTAVLLLFPLHIVIAEEPEWLTNVLKQDNPNELAYLVNTEDDCTVSEQEAKSIVESVLIRSRIILAKYYREIAFDIKPDEILYVHACAISIQVETPKLGPDILGVFMGNTGCY